MKLFRIICLLFTLASGFPALAQVHRYYAPHITTASPWINKVTVYNNGDQPAYFKLILVKTDGETALTEQHTVGPDSLLAFVLSNFAGYMPLEAEIVLAPVEGTLIVETPSKKIRPKISYIFGDKPSVSEFFLEGTLATEYLVPNPNYAHFSWMGVAVMNPNDAPIRVSFNSYRNSVQVGGALETVPANSKFVKLSSEISQGLDYEDFDQIRIFSSGETFPPPISITGNDTQDRHLFFNGVSTDGTVGTCVGYPFTTDSIVGDLVYIPPGTFLQGSELDEACRQEDELQFSHTITRPFLVMRTEVTREMWSSLKTLNPDLPDDPSDTTTSPDGNYPAQNIDLYLAILYANLLSRTQGLTPCYYTDSSKTQEITSTNYITDDLYCDFEADGYRLPTSGEWEYSARAGSTTPFWIEEPNYSTENCAETTCADCLPNLDSIAWFRMNRDDNAGPGTAKPVGLKSPNPWGLYDVHGNVYERIWDFYESSPTGEARTDYTGPETGSGRVIRGGQYGQNAGAIRSANLRGVPNTEARATFGFRLVRSVP